jgi:ER lumen protein retaining receptor
VHEATAASPPTTAFFRRLLLCPQVLWAFSIYLESVAILPQLFMLIRVKEVENLTAHYVFCLGGYRSLYLINWIYRRLTEDNYWQPIVWTCGMVQTLIYCDFFYYYIIAKKEGKKMQLPS